MFSIRGIDRTGLGNEWNTSNPHDLEQEYNTMRESAQIQHHQINPRDDIGKSF
jgi:hypothetical protein